MNTQPQSHPQSTNMFFQTFLKALSATVSSQDYILPRWAPKTLQPLATIVIDSGTHQIVIPVLKRLV